MKLNITLFFFVVTIFQYKNNPSKTKIVGDRCGRVPPSDHAEELKDPERHYDLKLWA